MIKFCPTCNRSSKDARFIGEFCEFCVAEKASKNFPSRATVEYCRRCGRIRTPGGYVANDKESLALVLAKELCSSKCKINVKEFDENSAKMEVELPVGSDSITFEKKIALKMVHKICQDDYRKSSGYYEATVQVRGDKESVEAMAGKIRRFIERNGAFIAKTEWHETGADIYVSNKTLIRGFFLLNKLAPKASYTLYSVKSGKKVYRNTYLLKL